MLKVGSQPPVPFFTPFSKAAEAKGEVDDDFIAVLHRTLLEEGWGVDSVLVNSNGLKQFNSSFPVQLVGDTNEFLMGCDIVFVLYE